MFNQIGQPRFNSPLIRFFGMKIGGAAAPTLAPEIAPSFDVNQQDDPQLRFLRGERVMQTFQGQAAVAGQYTRFRVRNPPTSGVLLVIRWFNLVCANQARYGYTANLTDEGSVSSFNTMDTRWTGTGAALFSKGTNVAAITDQASGTWAPTTVQQVFLDMVLAPGWAFWLYVETVNVTANLTVNVMERAIPAEELQTG
jgi:hypothetical protein